MSGKKLNDFNLLELTNMLGTELVPEKLLDDVAEAQTLWHRVGSGPLPPGALLALVVAYTRSHPASPPGPASATTKRLPETRETNGHESNGRPKKLTAWEATDNPVTGDTKRGTKVAAFRDGKFYFGALQQIKDGVVRIKLDGEKRWTAFSGDEVMVAKRG